MAMTQSIINAQGQLQTVSMVTALRLPVTWDDFMAEYGHELENCQVDLVCVDVGQTPYVYGYVHHDTFHTAQGFVSHTPFTVSTVSML